MSAPKVQLESYSAPTSPNSAIEPWTMESWQKRPIAQQPEYKDKAQLQSCLDKIRSLPPLVHPNEINSLRKQLADACRGERFVLQGGDCAERFQDCRKDSIEAKLKILLQMSLVLVWGARIPTIRIGRVAGQYGKPRSAPTEIVNGKELMCFKGDNVNGFDATAEAREHDPARLVEGHFHSACTLNYIRALIKGGYADLHHARVWDLGYVAEAKRREQYQEITSRILDSLDFMRTVGVGEDDAAVGQVDFFTSHEGLILAYEAAVTREVIHETRKGRRHLRPDPLLPAAKSLAPTSPSTEGPSPLASPDASAGRIIESHPPSPVQGDASLPPSRSANLLPAPTDLSGVNQAAPAAPAAAESLVRYYNTGAHFLWIGDRTRQLDGAHIEYFRGVVNPIGCKVGPSMKPQELVELIKTVDPNNEPGRLSLITRFGAENVRTHLPPLLKAVQEAGLQVLWICDPMHGNTVKTKSSIKTRRFDAIMEEITTTFKIHQEHGSHLGGVHFELTGEDVTECVGGPQDLEEDDLHLNYTTYCDPRLNYAQSMEVSFKLAQLLRSSRR